MLTGGHRRQLPTRRDKIVRRVGDDREGGRFGRSATTSRQEQVSTFCGS